MDQVGDRHPRRDLEAELFGALLDGRRPGIGAGTSDRQAVVGDHAPTLGAPVRRASDG